MKTGAIRVFLAGSCLLSGSLLAQTYELEDIVITAGNSPIARSHSATPHSIINRAAIEASGDISIRKLLGQVPGLTVSSSGNSTTQVRMRGGEANHTLVMINGISAAAGDGEYNFSGISAQDIERIEIFRGPQTVFFGPSASSGVINIITRSHLEDRLETSAQLGQTNRLYAAKSLQLGQMTGVASLLSEQDRGYDYSFANGEKDGIKRQTVEIRSNLITDNGIETALSFRRSDESYDIDDVNFGATSYRTYLTDSASSGDKDETLAAIQLAINADDQKTRHEIRLQQTKFVDVYNGTRRSNSDKSVLGYQLQRSFTAQPISESTFTGALILEKNADRNRMSPVEKRNGDAVGVEFRKTTDEQGHFQVGLRLDKSNKYKDAATWKFGYRQEVNAQTSLLVDIGSGVVNPTYFEIYGGWGVTGNPNLTPERNNSVSLGVEHTASDSDSQFTAFVFSDRLKNEISTNWGTSTIYNESGTSTRKGFEAEFTAPLGTQFQFDGNYTYLIAKNPDGTRETRRPRHMVGANLHYDIWPQHNGSLSLKSKTVIGNYDQDFALTGYPTNRLPDYIAIDFVGRMDLAPQTQLVFEIGNLTNRRYYDVWGYNTVGRHVNLRLTSRW